MSQRLASLSDVDRSSDIAARTVYHGTGRLAWETWIQQEGLRPSVLGYTVTSIWRVARAFANDWDCPEQGDEGIVIRIDIPRAEFGIYVDEGSAQDGEYCLRQTIPPRYLQEDVPT